MEDIKINVEDRTADKDTIILIRTPAHSTVPTIIRTVTTTNMLNRNLFIPFLDHQDDWIV